MEKTNLTEKQFNLARHYMWLHRDEFIDSLTKELNYLSLAKKTAIIIEALNEDSSVPSELIKLALDHNLVKSE